MDAHTRLRDTRVILAAGWRSALLARVAQADYIVRVSLFIHRHKGACSALILRVVHSSELRRAILYSSNTVALYFHSRASDVADWPREERNARD